MSRIQGAEYLRWDKTVNMAAAEMVWNLGPFAGPVELDDPFFIELVRRLYAMQRDKWPNPGFIVLDLDLDLDVTYERGDMLFRFSLSWDGDHFRPCEIAVDGFLVNPTDLN